VCILLFDENQATPTDFLAETADSLKIKGIQPRSHHYSNWNSAVSHSENTEIV
jgi:hypothetical protein